MGDVRYIWWRGKRFTPEMKGAIQAAEQRAGFQFTITQGGFNGTAVAASAGTHAGDAVDISIRGMDKARCAKAVEALRWAGIAAWLRTSTALWGVRAQGFGSPHIHGVPNSWGLPSPGADHQARRYRAGRDGLRQDRADIGPGHTSAYYSKTRPERPDTRTDLERLLDTMNTADLATLVRKATDHIPSAVLGARIPVVREDKPTTRTLGTLVESHDAALARLEAAVQALRDEAASNQG